MLQSASIEYKHDGYLCEGFAVWDEAGAKRPGILVFPEWVGVGEYTFKRAQMLGDLGFNAFVVDIYAIKFIRADIPTCDVPSCISRSSSTISKSQKSENASSSIARVYRFSICFGPPVRY